jgi:hypothetical protein
MSLYEFILSKSQQWVKEESVLCGEIG